MKLFSLSRRLGISASDLAGFAALGITGFLSAAALLVLGSNRVPGVSAELVTAIVLMVQWHALGWALSKLGIDYAVFNIVAKHPDRYFRLGDVLRGPSLAVTLCFGIACGLLFEPKVAALLAAAIVADTLSAIRGAELNARRRFYITAFGNALNYPLFVVLLWALSRQTPVTFPVAVGLFTLTSWLRLIWFVACSHGLFRTRQPARITLHGTVAMQGALNVGLFKLDQIGLAALFFCGAQSLAADRDLAGQLAFLGRIIDVATGVLVVAGTVWFPKHPLLPPLLGGANRHKLMLSLFAVGGLLIAGGIAVWLALPVYNGAQPGWTLWIPFAVQIPLIFMANYLTFSLQRAEHFPALLRNQFLGVLAGAGCLAAFVTTLQGAWLAWLIPVQLAVFVAASTLAGWGAARSVHEVRA